MAKKTRKQVEPVVQQELNTTNEVLDTTNELDDKMEVVEEIPAVIEDDVDSNTELYEQPTNLFSVDLSNYGLKKDEAEKFINNAIKFYFENRDKNFVVSEEETTLDTKNTDVSPVINEFEKSLKLFNYVPKQKVLNFLKELKEKL